MCEQQSVEFSNAARKGFFGTYSANPSEFRFTEQEKQLILALAQLGDKSNEDDILTALQELNLDDDEGGIPSWYFVDEMQESSLISLQCRENAVEASAEENTHTHVILKKLLAIADRNCHRPPAGHRFDRDVKDWAAFIRMLAGPLGYAAIQENLRLALPSLSTINHYIQNTKVITEGVLRPQELLLY